MRHSDQLYPFHVQNTKRLTKSGIYDIFYIINTPIQEGIQMLFNSVQFLIFFPIVALFYFLIPHRFRYLWLLAASYYFYMCWNSKYALLMLTSTAITYLSGLLIHRADLQGRERLKKLWVAVSFISNLSILFLFKYFDFAIGNLNRVLERLGIALIEPGFSLLLPVGISFYTFQALSYTMDVYRRDVQVETNFLKYALFVSFFPQLVAGPIERSSNLIHQIHEKHTFDLHRAARGLCLMLWGFFQKLVIADRAAIFVNEVYNHSVSPRNSTIVVLLATVLFAFQIYCDFSSYSDIARGAAEVMGFRLMKNFDTPYFSQSVSEFWRRWHISLSSWFRDYLYIPLGGNRKGTLRKYVNLMIVFCVSGLWHGASWNFIIWGALNGVYQVIGAIMKPARQRMANRLGCKDTFSGKLLRVIITFALINFSWIFFRANSTRGALQLIESLFRFEPWVLTDGSLFTFGLDAADMFVLFLSILVLFVVSVAKYKHLNIREWFFLQGIWMRYVVYWGALLAILVFGIYGGNYNAAEFIYFQF